MGEKTMAGPVTHEFWSSRFAFLMAAVGSSVGLGNLWRFSAEAGTNGGGAFVVVYVGCILLIGLPILMSEFIIGRASNAASAVNSVTDLAERSGVSRGWGSLAWVGMIASFLIVAFYCVVAAWVLSYIPKFLFGSFAGQEPEVISAQFGEMANNSGGVIWWFTGFVILTAWLVSRGVHKGIEWAAKFLMPIFFILLFSLAAYGLFSSFGVEVTTEKGEVSNAGYQAMAFLFAPDFSKINMEVIRSALGQAFFSIGIGSAIMITYGSYLSQSVNIPKSATIIVLTDTGVALMAGIAIFPIVFAHGLAVNSGAGLFFETLPIALVSNPGGQFVGAAFFLLAIFAAVTSSISLLEPSVAYVMEKTGVSRKQVTWALGLVLWAVGAGVVHNTLEADSYMNFLDGITSTWMLPLSGMLVVLFVGWRMNKALVDEQMHGTSPWAKALLLFLVRFVAPIAVGTILVFGTWEKYLKPLFA